MNRPRKRKLAKNANRPEPKGHISSPAGCVPPEIAQFDYELAIDLTWRLADSYRLCESAAKPWNEATRQAIEWLVDTGPVLLDCCGALVDSVAMFVEPEATTDWKAVMQRRNAALVLICMYADFPEMLDSFVTDKRILGLPAVFNVARGGLKNENPDDWKYSIAAGEALLKCDWLAAEKPYGLLRTVSARLQYEKIRELRARTCRAEVSVDSDQGVMDLDRAAYILQEQWKYESNFHAEFANEARRRHSADELIAGLRQLVSGYSDEAAYLDAFIKSIHPAGVKNALGWTSTRIRQARRRLLEIARDNLVARR